MNEDKKYLLTSEQLKPIRLAEESYLIYYNKFDKLEYSRKDELLEAGFLILKDRLKIDEPSALIIQQLINFKITMIKMYGPRIRKTVEKLLDEEIQFIIKLILNKYELDYGNRTDS